MFIYTNANGRKFRWPLNELDTNGDTVPDWAADYDGDNFIDTANITGGINSDTTDFHGAAGTTSDDCPAGCVADSSSTEILVGHDDWSRISLPFYQLGNSADSAVNPETDAPPTLGTLIAMWEILESESFNGQVWSNLNGNGIQDSGEPALRGVTVELFDSEDSVMDNGNDKPLDTVVTDAAGEYLFDRRKLLDGRYYLWFVEPPEHALSPQDQGSDDDLDSDPDRNTGLIDFSPQVVIDSVGAGMLMLEPDRLEQKDQMDGAAHLGVMPGVHIDQLSISAADDDD